MDDGWLDGEADMDIWTDGWWMMMVEGNMGRWMNRWING